jgi:hypothetical protein
MNLVNLRGEVVSDEDTSRAGLGGEVRQLRATVEKGLEAVVAETSMWLRSLTRAANGHTETLGRCQMFPYQR